MTMRALADTAEDAPWYREVRNSRHVDAQAGAPRGRAFGDRFESCVEGHFCYPAFGQGWQSVAWFWAPLPPLASLMMSMPLNGNPPQAYRTTTGLSVPWGGASPDRF